VVLRFRGIFRRHLNGVKKVCLFLNIKRSMCSMYLLVAAEAGDIMAQSNVGEMLYDGEGTPRDFQKAFEWLQKGNHCRIFY
jgi:TPR repeat protein